MQVYSSWPIFGVEFDKELKPGALEEVTVEPIEDDVEIIDNEGTSNAFAAYYADSHQDVDREPEFNETLGLAMEKMRDGLTLKSLWEVIPS